MRLRSRRPWAATLAVLTVLLTACGGGNGDGSDNGEARTAATEPGHVSRAQFGKAWPLTVDEGVLNCVGSEAVGAVTFEAPDGNRYWVNGLAKQEAETRGYADLYDIWADATDGYGGKKDISPLIDRGLELC